jgi:CHAT domain
VQIFRQNAGDGRKPDLPDESDNEARENISLELRQKIFDSLKPYLSQNLLIAADGELNCLPFEILPKDAGGYLIEDYDIHYLGVGRDILRFGACGGDKSPIKLTG